MAQAVYQMISTADTSGLEEFMTLFAYEGFNPEMVHEHMAKVKQEKGISDHEFVNDIRGLITLGALKGNYTAKNKAKISEAGRERADALFKKYGMKEGSLAGERKAIILPRVLSAFPELTTKVILKVPHRNFGERTSALPKIMKNPVFPALVPHGLKAEVKCHLLWLYCVYSADQSTAISRVAQDFDVAYDSQMQYIEIAHQSSVPPESVRVSMFRAQIEDIVQGVSSTKSLTTKQKPVASIGAAETRAAINEL